MKHLKTYENEKLKKDPGKIYYAFINIDRLQAFVNKAKKLKMTINIFNVEFESVLTIAVMTEDFKNKNFKRYPYFNEDLNTVKFIIAEYENIPIENIPEFIKDFNIKKDANKYGI